jgi:hypothetical protein
VNALAWHTAFVDAQHKDFFASSAAGENHAFAGAELHLPRREIRATNHQTSDQLFRFVSRFDAGEDRTPFVAA